MNKVIEEDMKLHKQALQLLNFLEEEGVDADQKYRIIDRMRDVLLTKARTLSDLRYPIEIIKEKATSLVMWSENLELVVKIYEEKSAAEAKGKEDASTD